MGEGREGLLDSAIIVAASVGAQMLWKSASENTMNGHLLARVGGEFVYFRNEGLKDRC